LYEDEIVSWELGYTLKGGPKAVNVKPLQRPPILLDSNHRETAVMESFGQKTPQGVAGFARRERGGYLYVHSAYMDIDPEFLGQALIDLAKPGTKINTGIAPPFGKKPRAAWMAKDFYIID